MVRWLPHGSLAERQAWAEDRPWLAACYFGFGIAVLFGVAVGVRFGVGVGVLLAVVCWPSAGVFFALAVKYRGVERPNASAFAAPTIFRLWSRASDRLIFWMMLVGMASGAVWAGELVGHSTNLVVGVVGLGAAVWLAATAFSERARRRTANRDHG